MKTMRGSLKNLKGATAKARPFSCAFDYSKPKPPIPASGSVVHSQPTLVGKKVNRKYA